MLTRLFCLSLKYVCSRICKYLINVCVFMRYKQKQKHFVSFSNLHFETYFFSKLFEKKTEMSIVFSMQGKVYYICTCSPVDGLK